MKKIIFLVAFILLTFVPLISAVEININNNFSQGETLIGKITGVFMQDITSDNLILYRDYHVKSPMNFEVYKIDKNNYYFYTQLSDKIPGVYSVVLNNIQYQQGGKILRNEIWENFTIKNDSADFYVNPGFIASKNDFSVELVNYKENSLDVEKIIVNSSSKENVSSGGGFFDSLFGISSVKNNSEIINLLPGETKSVDFKISDFSDNLESFIQLTSNNTEYFIPVINLSQSSSEEGKTGNLFFDSSDINISMATNSTNSIIVYLKNSRNLDLENVSLTVSDSIKDYVNISEDKIDLIKANSSEKIYVNFSSGIYNFSANGSLLATSSEGFSDSLIISLNVIQNYIPPMNNNSSSNIILNNSTAYSKYCSELGGKICVSGQKCNSTTQDAKDGTCCLNYGCQDVPPSNTGKIIGWIIVGIVVLFVLWFYAKRYTRPKKSVNVLEVAQGKKENKK